MKRNKPRGRGIRTRIMLYLVLFVAFVIAMLWLFQIVLLDEFYRYSKTNQVISSASAMLENLDNTEVNVLADHLSSKNDVCILVLDENHNVVISSKDTQFCLIHRMTTRNLQWWCSRIPEDGSTLLEQFNVQPFHDKRYNPGRFEGNPPSMRDTMHQSLLYARRITFPSGEPGYMLLNAIITPLDATVTTLRSQLLLITGIVLLAALVLTNLIAHKMALPIVETSTAARELSFGRFRKARHAGSYREVEELNATLSRAAEDLNQVERLQHELIANISHDLRTPLTMISGYAEAVRDFPGEDPSENMQVIIDETERLTTLVSEVMDFSRLQSGSLPMNPEAFDLTAAIEEIIGRISKLVEKNGYRIRFEPAARYTVIADEARIGQVIYNLVGNALTYTGEDKTVVLTQTLVENRVRISVQDTGSGIPQEELPMIWHRYYRTHESHRRAIIGSGLGLSIVRSILEHHQVPFGVDSQEGEGTVFWFELPLQD